MWRRTLFVVSRTSRLRAAARSRPVLCPQPESRAVDEGGLALILALLATMVLSALGLTLLVTASTETLIAGQYRDGLEALHAADGALERAIADVGVMPDWTPLLRSPDGFVAGTPATFGEALSRVVLPDGLPLDLGKATNRLNCPQVFPPPSTPCAEAQMDLAAGERPWGTNNPRWRLFARGWLSRLTPGVDVNSPFFVAVWVSDDPSESDADPSTDGGGSGNAGANIIQLRSEAFGRDGAHRAVEATLARAGAGARIVSWRLIR